ncbi:MAG: hypothetical protein WCK49_01760 [Myxococcaceae bacterium]
MRLFILSFLFVSLAQANGYQGQFGVRLTAGGAAYLGGIDNTVNRTAADANAYKDTTGNSKASLPDYTKYISAGWVVPLQLEATYSFTNAFEILLGGRYGFSKAFSGNDDYIMQSFGLALGYRYYFNTEDTIKAYMSSQIAIDLVKFTRLESRTAFGFLVEITPMVGVFFESNFALAGLYNSDSATGKGVQFGAGAAAGLQLHF